MRITQFLLITFFLSASVYAADLPDFTKLVEENSKAVVNISTSHTVKKRGWHNRLPDGMEIPDDAMGELLRRFFGDQMPDQPSDRKMSSLGSGFIVSSDGYVMTNNHVVSEADEVIVRLSDRRELVAEVIGTDPRSDIALLKIEADDLPVVKIGQSEKLKVGEWVLAIGSPFGFDHSVTAGIVSAKGRSLPNENYVPFIQTDVAINPGNSGGPLFNLSGEVVGVNSQIYSRTGGFMGLSFAIPMDVAMDVADQLKTSGRVSRGWLGVLIQEVTRDLAESFNMKKPYGALISQVLPDSPAKKGGLRLGDIIIEFNGRTVNKSAELPPMVGSIRVGGSAKVKILRDGRTKTLSIKIGELPEEEVVADSGGQKPNNQSDTLGLLVKEPDEKTKARYNLPEGTVVVLDVRAGSPAAKAGIRAGDAIVRINNKQIKGLKDFMQQMENASSGTSLPLLIKRGDNPLFVPLKIPKK